MRARILIGVTVGVWLAGVVQAQTPTGTIGGRVSDQSGASVPGVTVTAASPNLQGTRVVVTTETGDYLIPLLPPGDYEVRFDLQGFQAVSRRSTPSMPGR